MATLYQRKTTKGNAWTLQWRVNGKRFRKSLGVISEKDALLKKNAKERALIKGVAESVNVPTVEQYAKDYLRCYKIEKPDSHYRVSQVIKDHLVPHFGSYPLDRIKLPSTRKYKAKRIITATNPKCTDKPLEYVKASTINKELRTLHAMVNQAIKDEIITRNPLRDMEFLPELDSKAPDFFSKEELGILYETSPLAHWFKLLASTGMRASEARNLLWSNIKDNLIMVESTGQRQKKGGVSEGRTKSGKWRPIPLTPQSREALLTFWRIECDDDTVTTLPAKNEPVFPKYHRRSFSRLIGKSITASGLSGSAHKFRHTFCSLCVIAGVPLYTVQKMAGHSSIKITEKYAHLNEKYFEGVADNVFNF